MPNHAAPAALPENAEHAGNADHTENGNHRPSRFSKVFPTAFPAALALLLALLLSPAASPAPAHAAVANSGSSATAAVVKATTPSARSATTAAARITAAVATPSRSASAVIVHGAATPARSATVAAAHATAAAAAPPHPRPAGVGTGPTVKSAYAGFTDVNDNGILDCGEPVDLIATFATNNSGTPALAGSLFAPVNGSAGITFLHGSVVVDPTLTNGCTGTIVAGNGPDDSDFRVDFSCPADPIDNNAWTLVVRYRATYTGTGAPTLSAGATANTTDGATYHDVVTVPAGTSCGAGGIPTEVALTKTAAGPATPGSLLVYTLTATDTSGAGDGGLQLVETVPPHTTYSSTGSSPGWTCTPPSSGSAGGAAGKAGDMGSTCRNPIGNLGPNASLSTFFAVTLDATLPAAPVAIPNTACVDAGTTLAACASTSTPAAGTPTLHLAKALAAGSPSTAVPGATLAYTLTAANTGNQDLADATLQETVPANTTFAPGASSTGWTCNPASGAAGATCTLDLGPLAAQTTAANRTFAVTVADPLPALPPAYLLANTACLQTAVPGSAGTPASCSTVNTPITAQPVLHAAKTLRSGTGTPGTVLLYDLAVQNTGNEDASAVTATETVPANTTFAPSASAGGTPGWSCIPAAGTAGATCTLATGALPAGATAHLLFAVTVDLPLAAGVTAIANTACFQLAAVVEATSHPANAGTPASAASASSHPSRGSQSSHPSYTATHASSPATTTAAAAHAYGPGTTAAARVADPDTTHPAARGAGPATTPTGAKATASTSTCDTLSTPAQGHPLLALAKSYSGPPATAGAVLPYTLTATNTGDQDAAAVTLTETVPAHTTFAAAASTPGWSCVPASGAAGATCTLALGSLGGATAAAERPAATPPVAGATATTRRLRRSAAAPQGSTVTSTYALRVDSPLPSGVQQIANTACAAAAGLAPSCGQATSPPPTATPQLAAELSYTFVKNALRNGLATAGDILVYTLTVTNPSTATGAAANDVAILVPLDPHLILDAGSVTTTAGTVTAGNARGATTPAVQLATLAPGASCTIRFDATVGLLPPALRLLSTQATLTAANAPPTVSDDPGTPEPLDPTTTPVGLLPPPLIQPIPTLTTWGLLALAVLLAAGGLRGLHGVRHPRRPHPAAAAAAPRHGSPHPVTTSPAVAPPADPRPDPGALTPADSTNPRSTATPR